MGSQAEADSRADATGFLIGSLLGIPFDVLSERVREGFTAAGFTDLPPAHTGVLRALGPDGERVTDLARRMGTTKQATGYLVEALVRRGYLERAPDPSDGRAQIVRRTARGWAVNRTAREVVAQVQAEWTAALGAQRMALLLDALRALVESLGVDYRGSVADVSVRLDAQGGQPLDWLDQHAVEHGDLTGRASDRAASPAARGRRSRN
jgi:DNA-binding MarR family transcriptional regulator